MRLRQSLHPGLSLRFKVLIVLNVYGLHCEPIADASTTFPARRKRLIKNTSDLMRRSVAIMDHIVDSRIGNLLTWFKCLTRFSHA